MNMSQFINSNDAVEYFRIAFDADACDDLSLRYAWLICQSERAPLEDKHAAWQELIDTMPDQTIPVGTMRGRGLHECLRQYMELENRMIEALYAEESGAVYQHRIRKEDLTLHHWCWQTDWEMYPSFESCRFAYCTESHENAYGVRFEKQWVNGGTTSVWAFFTRDTKTLMNVGEQEYLCEEDARILRMFDKLEFSFPTPLERGCLVRRVSPYAYVGKSQVKEKIFVFDHIEGMKAHGFFVRPNGFVYKSYVENYMNLEIVSTLPCDELRSLTTIASYLQGEIDIGRLLNTNYRIRLETLCARERDT